MDVHRCRFVQYPASTINALAFSHQSTPKDSSEGLRHLRLAVGRANGVIEIWNPQRGNWVQETILRGGKDRSIEGLAWTHDQETKNKDGKVLPGKLRLYSVGYSTVITEWDLAQGKPLRHSGGNYGEIWCMAVQPRWQPTNNPTTTGKENEVYEQHLAVGCADGTLVLHSTADGDLRFLRTLARPSGKKSRVLSSAFLGRDRIIAGYADSTIRIYDICKGRQVSSMSLGAGRPGGPSEILVWCVKCLPDGSIVSGDSTGEVRFWDGQTFTLLQRIKSHKVDILALAVSADGSTVFSGGMDRRTAMYQKIGDSGKGKPQRWAEISHQRYHSHDIKVMSSFESSEISIVVSGGVDATPIIIPLKAFGREHVRSLPAFPSCAPLQSAPTRRLLMSWWDREVSIWRIERLWSEHDQSKDDMDPPPQRKLVAKIVVQGEENIASASMSYSGRLLAVSTVSEVKVFHLRAPKNSDAEGVKVQKVLCHGSLSRYGSKLLQFSPDGKWLLVVRTDNSIYMHRVTWTSDSRPKPHISKDAVVLPRLSRNYANQKSRCGTYGDYEKTIVRAAWSGDSRILVAGDLSGSLDSWVLEGSEDFTLGIAMVARNPNRPTKSDQEEDDDDDDDESDEESNPTIFFGQHWIRNPRAADLPRLPSSPLVLSFRPANITPGLCITNGNTTLHPTRHNPHPHSHDLPKGENRLFVLTTLHQVFEFHILSGRLSDWSRRNPSNGLPLDFRSIRDRAIDCLWDIGEEKQRVWLYGSSWLWMFDLSKDFPIVQQNSTKEAQANGNRSEVMKSDKKRKRKQRQQDKSELMKNTSGAGSRIPNEELNLGTGNKIRKTVGLDSSESQWVTLEARNSQAREEEEDDDGLGETLGEMSALVSLRRAAGARGDEMASANGGGTATEEGISNNDDGAELQNSGGRPYSWHTFKYRPILGIVRLGGKGGVEGEGMTDGGEVYAPSAGIEVALVERPLWELDLPARYHGDQEWEK